ncbi:cupin domain-containing protein [Altererythrobacter sp. GH1-8]|uniref:cupin domain-containing protein n=1 Tax=Altererythrobacter sp. GH1-8 TaxID=3349333 RepID=UPI00374D5EAF
METHAMRRMEDRRTMIAAALMIIAQASGPVAVQAMPDPEPVRYADPPDLVLGLDADEIEAVPYFNGLLLRTALRNSSDGSYAAKVTFLADEKMGSGPIGRDYHIYVLEGEMRFGEVTLGQGDLAYLPQGTDVGGLSGTVGTTYLMFGRAKRKEPVAAGEAVFVRAADVEWRKGTVAAAGGADAELLIKPLWTDAETGARVHLVKIAPGVTVPWEIHPSAEEGYLLEGDYKLAECLPSGRRDYSYNEGGYFYRPGGVMHSGPDSFTSTGATWLIRTPAELTALFYPSCPAAPALEETQP